MKIKYLGIATMIASLAFVPTVVAPAAAAGGDRCGFIQEKGKMVYAGVCSGEEGASNPTPSDPGNAPSGGCGDQPKSAGYRWQVAGC